MADLPSGTLTFLFTDIEGSTRLWEAQPSAMRVAVDRHTRLLRDAIAAHQGQVFRSVGDGLCAAFATAPEAVAAALAGQRALLAEDWGVLGPLGARMALHTGAVELQDSDYVGACLNRLGRLLAAGHGGQVLLSEVTAGLVRGALPEGASLRDLGEQRLRDLGQAEHVYQLLHPDLPAEFPPLRSLDAYPHNLPLQLTSFVGRERELAGLKAALEQSRLVTLTGTGGCGKTRLALQVAAEALERYPDGAWLVELAPLADPTLVAATVASVVMVREQPGQPIQQTLTAGLRSKQLLLVLDNCEHLVEACAQLAEAVLRACAQVRLLATSRELLAVPGERAYRVPSLGLPDASGSLDPEAALGSEAVCLFVERARLVRPDFALTVGNTAAVVAICHRLDGIPLAIELAAARLRVLAPEQLLARLRDWFRLLTGGRTALRRQQTLQAAIDWSHDLLSDAEQRLFRRLAVFASGFTLEGAEAVVGGDDLARQDVLDLLTQVVDRSLVQTENAETATRYRLLETIRQYAEAKLLAAGEAAMTRDCHAAYYLALAEQAQQRLPGEHYKAWLRRRLEDSTAREEDNLRMALAWYLENADAKRALRLGSALLSVWPYRGRLGEVRALVAALLTVAEGSHLAEARARLLHDAAVYVYVQGDYAAARAWFEESAATWRQGQDRQRLAETLWFLGLPTREQGDYDAAQAALEEALALARELDEPGLVRGATQRLGEVAHARGDHALAQSLYEETLAMSEAAGEFEPWAAHHLARLYLDRGDHAMARTWLARGLLIHEAGLHPFARMAGLTLAAAVAAAEGQPERALRLAGAAAHLREIHGYARTPTARRFYAPWLDAARRTLGEEAAARAEAVGRAMTEGEAIALALAEDGLT